MELKQVLKERRTVRRFSQTPIPDEELHELIDAARQVVVRTKGQTGLAPEEIPELLDPELPQQLLVSAFRRYRR